MQQNIINET